MCCCLCFVDPSDRRNRVRSISSDIGSSCGIRVVSFYAAWNASGARNTYYQRWVKEWIELQWIWDRMHYNLYSLQLGLLGIKTLHRCSDNELQFLLIFPGYQVDVFGIENTVLLDAPIKVQVTPGLPLIRLTTSLPLAMQLTHANPEDEHYQTLFSSLSSYRGHR